MNEFITDYSVALLILILWFETNAIFEYLRWIPLPLFKKYHIFLQTNSDYMVEFISGTYNSFLSRLITCPYCLTLWISILLSISNLTIIPILYVAVVVTYKIVFL